MKFHRRERIELIHRMKSASLVELELNLYNMDSGPKLTYRVALLVIRNSNGELRIPILFQHQVDCKETRKMEEVRSRALRIFCSV